MSSTGGTRTATKSGRASSSELFNNQFLTDNNFFTTTNVGSSSITYTANNIN
jgi:hypothetical protein